MRQLSLMGATCIFLISTITASAVNIMGLETVYGPKDFSPVRKNRFQHDSFNMPSVGNGSYSLKIVNGYGRDLNEKDCHGFKGLKKRFCVWGNDFRRFRKKLTRVKSLEVILNGKRIVKKRQVNRNILTLDVPITNIKKNKNKLKVRVKGWRTSKVTLEIVHNYDSQLPVPSFVFIQPGGVDPLKIQFDASESRGTSGGALDFDWSFGDGSTGVGEFVDHFYGSPGVYSVELTITDSDGRSNSLTKDVTVIDLVPPVLTLQSPNEGEEFGIGQEIQVVGTSNKPLAHAILNGQEISLSTDGLQFNGVVSFLDEGDQNISVFAADEKGNSATVQRVVSIADQTPLTITVLSPEEGAEFTVGQNILVTGAGNKSLSQVSVNGIPLNLESNGTDFTGNISFPLPGHQSLLFEAVSSEGGTVSLTRTVLVKDLTSPVIEITSPTEGAEFPVGQNISISGSSNELLGSVTVNGQTLTVGSDGVSFTGGLSLTVLGPQTLKFIAKDIAGNSTSATRNIVIKDVTAPVIAVSSPTEGQEFGVDISISISGTSNEKLSSVTLNGQALTLAQGALSFSGSTSFAAKGSKSLNFVGTDLAGNTQSLSRTIVIKDLTAPVIAVTSPTEGQEFGVGSDVSLSGTSNEELASITLNGQALTLAPGGLSFSGSTSFDTLGAQILNFVGTDLEGNSQFLTRNVVIKDITAPVIAVISPTEGQEFGVGADISLSGTSNEELASITLNGQALTLAPGGLSFSGSASFAELGPQTLSFVATDLAGNTQVLDRGVVINDVTAPVIVVSSPTQGEIFGIGETITLVGSSDEALGQITVNGQPLTMSVDQLGFSGSISFAGAGEQHLVFSGTDLSGNTTELDRTIHTADLTGPVLSIMSPVAGAQFEINQSISISGSADEPVTSVSLNGQALTLASDEVNFSGTLSFSNAGPQLLSFSAIDKAGNTGSVDVSIDITLPANEPPVALFTTGQPTGVAPHLAMFDASASSDPESGPLTFSWDFGDGQVGTGSTISHLFQNSGSYQVELTVKDQFGATGTHTVIITGTEAVIPPDPAPIAPPIPPTQITSVSKSLEFLFTGADPIQVGVLANTIDEIQAAGIRGRVLTRAGTGLGGVKITVKDHPEFGHTLTRADGFFDMVINGGGNFLFKMERPGFLPSQRLASVTWGAHGVIPDVVMVGLDPMVTKVTMGQAQAQIAISSQVTDVEGARSIKVIFPAGTQAELVLADGTRVVANDLNIRMTEYTVGASGPNAMPATLPSNSGYTYAVELSADEAILAGAREVEFDREVPVYVDNFLGFPVGEHVPSGYLDRTSGKWVPSKDGLIIKIIGDSGGLAQIDVDGSSVAADSTKLALLGLNNDELALLAANYAVGTSLWRVPVTHFTPWDFNWPYGPPPNSMNPGNVAGPSKGSGSGGGSGGAGGSSGEGGGGGSCGGERFGSVIEIDEQILREDLDLPGLPFSLHYRSERADSFNVSNQFDIMVTTADGTLPARVDLELEIAGRKITQQIVSPGVNQSATMSWDGKDVFGRTVSGPVRGRLSVIYQFVPYYFGIASEATATSALQFESSFSQFSPTARVIGSRGSGTIPVAQSYDVTLGKARSIKEAFGGWTPSDWHQYEPVSKKVFLGNGRVESAVTLDGVIDTIGGTLRCGNGGDGNAIQIDICRPENIDATADGTIYVAEQVFIRKIKDGVMTKIAGNGTITFAPDGTLALNSGIPVGLRDVAVSPEGEVYILTNNWLKKIDLNGRLQSVAGNGTAGSSGDGGLAINATILTPGRMAFDKDGNLYMAASADGKIRKIDTNGVINSVNKTFTSNTNSGDGGPVALATFANITAMTVDGEGNILVAAGNLIRKIGKDGIVTTLAGNGVTNILGDGVRADFASFSNRISDLAVDPVSGAVYVTEPGGSFSGGNKGSSIRRILPGGIVETVAGAGIAPIPGAPGDGVRGYNGNGQNARATLLNDPVGVAVLPTGEIVFADRRNHLIRKIRSVLPGVSGNDIAVVSSGGDSIYIFSPDGRHLETRDGLNGEVVTQFDYSSDLLPIGRIDQHGLKTDFVRDANGLLQSINSPEGRVYPIALNANGWVSSVGNPNGEAHSMDYWDAGGLLSQFNKPRGGYSHFEYDAAGRLTRDSNSAGGFFDLVKTLDPLNPSKQQVRLTSAEGRVDVYEIERVGTVRTFSKLTDADGRVFQSNSASSDFDEIKPEGSLVSYTLAPDPRWGMSSPYKKDLVIALPSGLTNTRLVAKTATFQTVSGQPDLVTMTIATSVNGNVSTNLYTAATGEFQMTSPEGRNTSVIIDQFRQPVQATIDGLTSVSFSYNGNGKLLQKTQGPRVTTNTYDAQGFLATTTNALGETTSFDYDAVGRVTQTTFPDGRIVLNRYDLDGNLVGITPAGRPEHTFTFDSINLVTGYQPPLAGFPVKDTTYSYNMDKQLTSINRPDGKIVTYTYDPLKNHLNSVTTASGVYSYGYDPVSGLRVTSSSPDGIDLVFSYDGPLLTQSSWSGVVSGAVDYTYNSDFKLASTTVGGQIVGYAYDGDGLLTQAGDVTYTRDGQNGSLTGLTVGTLAETIGYNTFGEEVNHSGAQVSWVYERDLLGRVIKKTETIGGVTHVFDYSYDQAGRLFESKKDGVVQNNYVFDQNSNRLSKNGLVSTYDDQDRLLTFGDFSYTYNENGDLGSKTNTSNGETTSYNYDSFGNLKRVILPDGTKVEYLIDAQNRRVGKKVNDNLTQGFLYRDEINPIVELDGLGAVVARFVYGSKVNVPDYMIKGGQTYRIVSDYLGSVRFVVNASNGTIIQEMDYDEFGVITKDTNPGFQPFGFAGGLYDVATGLVRYGARDYQPETGRWTSKDPILFDGDGPNLYGYVVHDPLNRLDPLGLSGVGPGRGFDRRRNSDFIEELARQARESKEFKEKYRGIIEEPTILPPRERGNDAAGRRGENNYGDSCSG